MELQKVQELLQAEVYAGKDYMTGMEVKEACGSDLMSDVLAFVKEQGLMLTGLQNLQVVRTAEMMDMEAIVFVRGKVPTEEMIQAAERMEMVLMTTELPMFTACGILYANGLTGGEAVSAGE
ncbi:MAG: hypothetical protein IJB80_00330 [Clostridia bacterium]|nr:hypothetical protein [Clostridia bacterium]